MDIAKYIGLYLLKNNFCYLHGLGNLEIRRKPASYEGDALHAPEYEVTLTPGGSIDDALANFIATHEQTSISKAANALRDFSVATRAELAAGKEVEIPGIGKFVEHSGVIRFIGSAQLQHLPPPVPVIRMAKRTEELPDFRREQPEGQRGSEVAWGKVTLLAVLAVVVIVAGIFAWRHFSNQPAEPAAVQDTVHAEPMPPSVAAPVPVDTVHRADTSVASVPATRAGEYTVVLNSYTTRGAAERRASFLSRNGNQVETLARDSSNFLVVMRMPASVADTTRMLDSLRRFFNPKGVHILH